MGEWMTRIRTMWNTVLGWGRTSSHPAPPTVPEDPVTRRPYYVG